jgi:hypothetical protein
MGISSQFPFPWSFNRQLAKLTFNCRDGYHNKPWIDKSPTAAQQFMNAQGAWESTWGEGDTRGMTVKSVKLFSRNICGA